MPSAIVGVVAPSTRVKEPHPADSGQNSFSPQSAGIGNRNMSMNATKTPSPSIRKKIPPPTPSKIPPTATINPINASRNRFGFHSSPKKITSNHNTTNSTPSSSAITSATVHPPPRYLRGNSTESNKSSSSAVNESPSIKLSTNKNTGPLAVTAVASIAAGGIERNNNGTRSNNNSNNNNDISRIRGMTQGVNCNSSPHNSQRSSLSPAKILNISSTKAGYLCIKNSTGEDLDTKSDFISAMQYCGKSL